MEATRLMGQPGADINPTLFPNDKWQSFYIDFLRPGSEKKYELNYRVFTTAKLICVLDNWLY